MKNLLYLLLPLAIALVSCETDPYQYEASDYIELKKDPCFGFCPVYTSKIDGKGNATFSGQRNVTKEGEWKMVLAPERCNALFQAFEKGGFFQFEDEYTAQVTDLPTTWTTLHLGTERKTIKDYFGAPAGLKELEKLVEEIAESDEGWEKAQAQENPGH